MGCLTKRGNVIAADRCEVKKNSIHHFKPLYLLHIPLDPEAICSAKVAI